MAGGATRFGARSTADEVLAGLDLSGRTLLVTGCAGGLGFETMRALAGRGARMVGLARDAARAADACARAGGAALPVACDLGDFASVVAAADRVRALGLTLDAVILNAGIMAPARPDVRNGAESQFRINHLGHMLLLARIEDLIRDEGRLVVVSSSAARGLAPKGGIAFDNLDAHLGYRKFTFYGQSKFANAAYARTMSERLAPRGIVANAVHPGVILSTGILRTLPGPARAALLLASPLTKTVEQGAATQCLLAAHPDVAGRTGGFWADCRPARTHPLVDDAELRARLWRVSEALLAEHAPG